MTNEELRRLSVTQFASLRRKALHEAQQNSPVVVMPTIASASGSGGGGYINSPIYGCGADGNLYDVITSEQFMIHFIGGDPGVGTQFTSEAVFCKGLGDYFYYLFYANSGTYNGFYFGTIDSKLGQINTNNNGNLYDVASSKTPSSLYLEPDGSLIMLDSKFYGEVKTISRIDTNYQDTGAWHAISVNEVDKALQEYGVLMCLFTIDGEVYGVSAQDGIGTIVSQTIGKYDINEPEYVSGTTHSLNLYKNGYHINYDGNYYDYTIISVVQGTDGIVYLSAFYDDPDSEQFEFGLFNVDVTTGIANWIKFSYIDGGPPILTMFTK